MADPLSIVEDLADWSPWVPFEDALEPAPLLPGAYMAREGNGPVVYVGMAGERPGGGRPKGLRGRLAVYATGKGLVSGLGEAVMDRALADSAWLRQRLTDVEAGRPMRAKDWGRAAFARAGLQLRWAVTADRAAACGAGAPHAGGLRPLRSVESQHAGCLRAVGMSGTP